MGYLLLAIETLTVSLLLVAVVVALASHRGRWVGRAFLAIAVGLCLAFYGLAILTDYNQEFVFDNGSTGLFVPLLIMTAFFVVGAAVIIYRGLRVDLTDQAEVENRSPRPAAHYWPRGRLALALGVALVLNLMTFSNLDAAARQNIGTLRSQAYALAMSVAPQPVPDDQNAATYYLQVFQASERENRAAQRPDDPRWKFWIDAVDALEPAAKAFDFGSAEVAEYVKSRQGEVDLLRRGAALPDYYYDRNYGQIDITDLQPDIQGMRDGARLLAIHARWSAATGDTKSALADATALGGLARHTAGDPFVVSLFVGSAIDRMCFDTLQGILRSQNPAVDALAEARVNHLFSYRQQTNRILRGEEAAMLNTMIDLDAQLAWSTAQWLGGADRDSTYFGHRHGAISVFGLGPLYRVFVLLPAMATYRAGMMRAHASTAMSYPEFKERMDRLKPELENKGIFASSVSSTLTTIDYTYRIDAYNLVAYTALAMHRYRAEHGRFPEKLEELAPDTIPIVPGDPFDEKLLKLQRTERGWIVYSVGPDMTDDRGAPLDLEKQRKGDIGFEYVEARDGATQ